LVAGLSLASGLWAEAPKASEKDAEVALEERLLREAGVGTDGPGLLAFFRSRTVSAADRERLKQAVRELGDDQFEVRERASNDLVRASRFALRMLRPVLEDPDLERARRAERCIEDIERTPSTALLTAAAHLASLRRPDGVTEAMLGCLPWVEDEGAEETLFRALAVTAVSRDHVDPALVAAGSDGEALRRAAAAHVLGRAGLEYRRQAVALLADADVRVRFQAACSLLRSGDRSAVPVLMAHLTDAPVNLAWQAEDLLCRVAGEQQPAVSAGAWDEASRRKNRAAWEAWWKQQERRVDLTRLNLDDVYLGLNVVAELDGAGRGGSRIWECGPDGKARWEISNVSRAIDAHLLPGGRVLVAEHGHSRVTERDRDGKVLWEQRVENQPVSCQRLPNGNTFIVTYNELLEVTPANAVVFSSKRPGMIYHGQKLRNGNMVYVQSNNQLVEVDPRGNELKTVSVGNTGGWASVEKEPSGTYLVALYSGRKVVEVDDRGKVLWECSVESPGHATRLRNGNVLVASIEGRKVMEINRAGTVVWQQATQGRPFHVYRR
jgi:hypothetical protein